MQKQRQDHKAIRDLNSIGDGRIAKVVLPGQSEFQGGILQGPCRGHSGIIRVEVEGIPIYRQQKKIVTSSLPTME